MVKMKNWKSLRNQTYAHHVFCESKVQNCENNQNEINRTLIEIDRTLIEINWRLSKAIELIERNRTVIEVIEINRINHKKPLKIRLIRLVFERFD